MTSRLNTAYTDPKVSDILDRIDKFNILTEINSPVRGVPDEVKQGPFRLTISLQNPRAEFLILHNSPPPEKLNETLINDLVKVFNSFVDFWNVPEVILSIHCGTWHSKNRTDDKMELKHRFLAYISFGDNKYKFLEIFIG